jgi:hypothetical protein
LGFNSFVGVLVLGFCGGVFVGFVGLSFGIHFLWSQRIS